MPGESLESIERVEKESGLYGRVLHRSMLKVRKSNISTGWSGCR